MRMITGDRVDIASIFRINEVDAGWLLEYPDGYWPEAKAGPSLCASLDEAIQLWRERTPSISVMICR